MERILASAMALIVNTFSVEESEPASELLMRVEEER